MKVKERLIYWCILILMVITVVATWNISKKQQRTADANILAAQSKTQSYLNELGTATATIQTLKLTRLQMQESVLGLDTQLKVLTKEFNSLQSVVKASNQTQIDTIQVTFRDTIPCTFQREDTVSKKWYRFKYSVNQRSITVTDLVIPDTLTVITGEKRKWFLGTKTLITDITHANPYSSTTIIKSAQTVEPDKWYQKWYVWLAAGLAGGFLIK